MASSPTWAEQLNLDQIAVIGDSLGSSTVMALAGADIIFPRLVEACDSDVFGAEFCPVPGVPRPLLAS
ncbi:MAG: hypothetical protein HC922_08885 [Leptolyngbyaceae cyanobacterium SM2_3_12]|nr:hypothetical protein [Leptolyngbyaceae cyanobacterium SM2_3_12]